MTSTKITTAYIALGSNKDKPLLQLQSAISQINRFPHTQLVRCSRFYWNKFIGNDAEPECLNAVIAIETGIEPLTLLQKLLRLEFKHQRQRSSDKAYSARTLDLDLLLYGKATIVEPGLVIPHPRMTERAFVIHPLAEIAPDLLLSNGQTVTAIRQQLQFDARIANIEEELVSV